MIPESASSVVTSPSAETSSSGTSAKVVPRASFWKRRMVEPLLAQLTQGITPDKLAATLAVSAACSMFPILGVSTILNFVVGLRFRMNLPIMQVLNQLLGPVHLFMIVVYVRSGEWILGVRDEHFSIKELMHAFSEESWAEFGERFGWAGIHAVTAWACSVPLIIGVLYYSLRPILQRVAAQRSLAAAEAEALRPPQP